MLQKTDRTRFRTSWGQCLRARWLGFHSGPTGYGIRKKSQAVPLVTGIVLHAGLEKLVKASTGDAPPVRAVARQLILETVARYRRGVEARGLESLGAQVGTDELSFLVEEQSALCEGLLWGAYRVFLPWLLSEFEVVACEEEEEMVLACTCGLGDGVGNGATHEGRECAGLLLMLRPDLIMRSRLGGSYANCDWKSGGQVKYKSWADQWLGDVQLAMGCVGAERRLGVDIAESFVFGMHKGPRKSTKLADGSDGPRRQDNLLCYAWKKVANPPHWAEEWRWSWNYVDEGGRNRTLQGKGFDKSPVWEAGFEQRPQGWTKMEYWVEVLPIEVVRELFVVVGPMQRPRHLLGDFLEGLAHEEDRWAGRNSAIYQAMVEAGSQRLDHPLVRAALNREVPQTRECIRYRSKCQFIRICNQEGDWADPLAGGEFELRRPHHQHEVDEMVARGIPVPAEQWEEEEEDE